MTKSVKITYKGKKETVEIDDDIAFGKIRQISDKHLNIPELMQGHIPPTMHEFILDLTKATIVKAPWNMSGEEWFDDLGYTTVKELVVEVTKIYPLEDFLKAMMEAFRIRE